MGYYQIEYRKSQYGEVWVIKGALITDLPAVEDIHPEMANVVAVVEGKEILLPMLIQVSRSGAWVNDDMFSSAINVYFDKKKAKANKAKLKTITVTEVRMWVDKLKIGDPSDVTSDNKNKWLKKIKKELSRRKRFPKKGEMLSRIEVVLNR